jgi:two-component system, NtrC family, response regulator GlrR
MEPFSVRVVDCVHGGPVAGELLEILNRCTWCKASPMIETGDVEALVREPDSIAVFVHPDAHQLESLLKKMRPGLISSPLVFVNLYRYPSPSLDLLKAGFNDFLTYPFRGDEIRSCLSSLWIRRERIHPTERDAARQNLTLELALRDLIGISPVFERVIQEIRILANSDATVLITGETGTGKDMCARAIHYASARSGKPFVPVNCGGIPEELFENEFFGHEKGAYTDARERYGGTVEQAEGGTIFLDDLDALSLKHQAKLLRFIQDPLFMPLGSSKVRRSNVRILSATNVDLSDRIYTGQFRQDLYYRLAVLELLLPPLRERVEDIGPLVEFFVHKYCRVYSKTLMTVAEPTLAKLVGLRWAGNVRELENVVHNAVAHADTEILDDHYFFSHNKLKGRALQSAPGIKSFKLMKQELVAGFEREYVEHLLQDCGGNVSEAARRAGKNRRAFWEIMRKYGISSSGK